MQKEMRRRTREAPTGSQKEENMKVRHTDIEAQKRKLGNRAMQQSKRIYGTLETGQAACRRGVLSGIVLSAWESHEHGEGPDGST